MKQCFIDYLGILWILFFTSFTLIALVLHGNYNPLTEALSKLGDGNGAIYFNTGLIIAGYLGSIIAYERYKDFNKLLCIIGILTMSALSFIGWFPIKHNLHGFFTGLMFTSMGVFFILYAVILRSYSVILMLLTYSILAFISLSLTEWIIFITINIWVGVTSTKFYYRSRSILNKFVNI